VLIEVGRKLVHGVVPAPDLMAGMGVVALVANAVVFALLRKRRGDDINMRSAWLCSRNDVTANAGVLLAAGGVGITGSAWPDIGVGLLIAAVFVTSAVGVSRRARQGLRSIAAG
jgi:Co/Zn/Cd efflux system component